MDVWVWVWVVLAAVFIIGELLTAGFFLLPFGIGAAVAAVLAFAGAGAGWQWAAFLVVSAAALVGARRFAERISHEPPEKVGVDRVLGKTATVIDTVGAEHTGHVRIEREQWRADSADGSEIPIGARVVVESVVGTRVIVRPAPTEEE